MQYYQIKYLLLILVLIFFLHIKTAQIFRLIFVQFFVKSYDI